MLCLKLALMQHEEQAAADACFFDISLEAMLVTCDGVNHQLVDVVDCALAQCRALIMRWY